jgi:hypothetical protein
MTEAENAIKKDQDKIRWELLSVDAMEEIAKVMTFGAKKYDAHNWRRGFDWSRLIGASYRHLSAWHNGQDVDPETGLSHLAHLGCCVMFLLEHEKRKLGKDDRYKHSKWDKELRQRYEDIKVKSIEDDGFVTVHPPIQTENY